MTRFLTLLPLFALPVKAETLSAELGSGLFTGDYLLQVIGSFFLVICVLLGVLVLLKRFNSVGPTKTDCVKVIATTPLGQRERAVLLQVGENQILVGVSPGGVNSLYQLPNPVTVPADERSVSFKDVWNYARSAQGGKQ